VPVQLARFDKFIGNNISIYVSKQIYYENIFYNEFNDTYFVSWILERVPYFPS
jgi:hypothetical protein